MVLKLAIYELKKNFLSLNRSEFKKRYIIEPGNPFFDRSPDRARHYSIFCVLEYFEAGFTLGTSRKPKPQSV